MTAKQLRVTALALVIGVASWVACDETLTPPTEHTLTVSIVSPGGTDGAAHFRLTGPGFIDVKAAASGEVVYWRLQSDNQVEVLLFGNITSGASLTIRVPDAGAANRYASELVEVADRSNDLQDISGYSVTISRTALD